MAALLALAAVVAIVMFFRSGVTVANVIAQARSLRHEWWTPIAYFAAYAVLNVLFIPTQLLSIASAVIWGWALGGTIELFAATLGALAPFSIARWLYPAAAQRYALPMLRREGTTLILILRLVPIVPYTALNYAAALSPVTLRQYTLATFGGMIPSTYIFAYFVDAIVNGILQPRDVFWRIALAGVLFATLVIATRLVALRLPEREAGTPRRTARTPDAAGRSEESPTSQP